MRYALYPESHAAHETTWGVTAVEDYPAPEWSSRDPWPDGVAEPSAVAKLRADGSGWGWTVRTQYSRGRVPHATTGRAGVVRDAFALRFGCHALAAGRAAYAVHRGGVWDGVWVWGPDLPPFGMCGVTELREYLEHAGRMDAAWLKTIRDRRAEQAGAAKARAKTGARPMRENGG